jgi:hypothetical protein
MQTHDRIDRLIETGWNVLETDFDPVAFHDWRVQAYEYLHAELGPEHPYTQNLQDYLMLDRTKSLLAVAGLLVAAKEVSAIDRQRLGN